ncbi:MAG: CoA-binding protein [Prosthecobacter sp.]
MILGASDSPERYSHQAQLLLQECGHTVVLVHPKLNEIKGLPVVADRSVCHFQLAEHRDIVCRPADFADVER